MSAHWLFVGANSDIAVAMARQLAEHRVSRVTLLSRNADELYRRRGDIEARLQVPVDIIELDLADDAASDNTFEHCELPDVAVIAAGVLRDTAELDDDPGATRDVIRTNYESVIVPTETLARRMRDRGSGSIIGLSSVAGLRGRPSNYVYGSTKAAMSAYLDGLQLRCQDTGVSVLKALIGMVDTKMTAGKPLPPLVTATPDDVATAILSAHSKGKTSAYCPGYWRWIMSLVRVMPGFVVRRM